MFRVLGIYNFGWGWKCSTPSIASPCHTLVFTGDKVERKELWLERQEILWTYFLLLVAAVLNKSLFVKFTATYFRIFNTSFVLMLSIHTQLAKYWIMILFKNVLIFTLTKRIQLPRILMQWNLAKRSYQILDFCEFLMPLCWWSSVCEKYPNNISCSWSVSRLYLVFSSELSGLVMDSMV